ncbi:MAG: hypothetical protein ACREPQ_04215 [Rhodanobacter sp.]
MLLVLLDGTVSPWRRLRGMASAHDVLDVRFIPVSARVSPDHVPQAVPVVARTPSVRQRKKPEAVTTTSADEHAAAVTPSQPPTTLRWDIPARADSGYIAGGNLLHDPFGARQSSVRLPGSGVAIVQGIHMIDPKMQGLGGIARKLQHLFGIPDKHCLNVDAWRRLSTREMLDSHISPDEVEKVAAEYHCFVPEHDPWLQ